MRTITRIFYFVVSALEMQRRQRLDLRKTLS
jgi:hypothetical protein